MQLLQQAIEDMDGMEIALGEDLEKEKKKSQDSPEDERRVEVVEEVVYTQKCTYVCRH